MAVFSKHLCCAAALALALAKGMPVNAEPSQATPYVRPDARAYLDALAKNPRPPMNDALVTMMRKIPPETIAQMLTTYEVPMGPIAVDKKLTMPGPGGPIDLRLFDPRAERGAGPVVVFYHGGGFVAGNIATHAPIAAEIARQLDMPVVSVEYRLALEHKWPAAPDDAEAAVRWIAANGAQFGRSVNSLVLAGDSAGGTLTLITGIALRDKPANVPLRLLLSIYPMADASRPYPSQKLFAEGYGLPPNDVAYYGLAYAPDVNSPRHSALLANLEGLPPTVLVTAPLDTLRDGGRAFGAKLVEVGVPVSFYEAKGNIHGFATFRKAIPSAQDDLNRIMAMVRVMLAEPKPR
jgi:acetyl esterase